MSEKSAMFLFIFGLLLAFGGAGGVETSIDNLSMFQSFLIAMVGLAISFCGVLAIRNQNIG